MLNVLPVDFWRFFPPSVLFTYTWGPVTSLCKEQDVPGDALQLCANEARGTAETLAGQRDLSGTWRAQAQESQGFIFFLLLLLLLIFIVYLNPVIANCWQGFICKSAPAQNFFYIVFTTDKNLPVLEHFLPNT